MKPLSPSWQAILTLCRFSNLPTVWSNVLAGWYLSGGGHLWQLAFMLAGGSLLYFGGTTLNDFADVRFDRQYRPERPIPSGIFSRATVGTMGFGWILIGSMCVLIGGANGWILTLLLAFIFGYTIIHKRTNWAGLLMGAARAMLVLLAWRSHTFDGILLIFWASSHFIYITGLTWLAAGESGPKQRIYPRVQSGLLLTPVAIALILGIAKFPGEIAVIVCGMLALAFTAWILPALPISKQPLLPPQAIPRMLAGIILIDGMALCWASPLLAAVVAFGLLPLTLRMQKSFAAT